MKKRALISIIIIANNRLDYLKRCIDSTKNLKNCQIVIINNFMENESEKIDAFLEKIDDERITYYQSDIELTKNKSKNLGMHFASGSWLYFINDYDVLTERFVNYLNKHKLNTSVNFYRLQFYNNNKKRRYDVLSTKYFSFNISSFLINEEWIKKLNITWNDNHIIEENLLFINNIYNYRNIETQKIKNLYSIIHNANMEKMEKYKDIDGIELNKVFNSLMQKKFSNYKQIIIVLLYNSYLNYKKYYKNSPSTMLQLKQLKKTAKINFFDFSKLGICFWLKTIRFRINLIMTKH